MNYPFVFKKDSVRVTLYRLTRKDGYKYFALAWYEKGERKRETFTVLAKAKARAEALLENLAEGKPELNALSLSDAEIYRLAVQRIAETDKSLLTVVDEYMRVWEKDFVKRTVTAVIKLYRDKKDAQERSLSDEYKKDLKYRLTIFVDDFGDRPIDEIKGEEVVAWLNKRRTRPTKKELKQGGNGRPWSARTKNNYLDLLRTFWNFARKIKALPRGDHALDLIEPWAAKDAAYSFMSYLDLILLFDVVATHKGRDQLLPFLALQAFGGLRVAETKRLAWEDVIAEDDKVVAISVNKEKAKTRSRRTVDVNEALESFLYEFKILRKCTGPIAKWSKIDDILHREASNHSIGWQHNQLRHTCATHLLRELKNPAAVALQLGTSQQMLAGHYSEVDVTPAETKGWFGIRHEIPQEVWDKYATNLTGDSADVGKSDVPF